MEKISSSTRDDEKMICSSIVMLQERFKQLEKVKEMREERELLKLISSTNNSNYNKILQQCNSSSSTASYDYHTCSNNYLYEPLPPSSKLFFNSEIIFPTRQQLDCQLLSLSLSLWPNSHHTTTYNCSSSSKNTQNLTSANCKSSWLSDVPLSHPPSLFKNINLETSIVNVNSDVDTTLHL